MQIEEAKARFESILNDTSDHNSRYAEAAKAMKVDFVCTHDIGDKVWAAGPPYDCVSCMFALHYFFHSEATARKAVEMAAKNLKEGGHFIGVLPNARHVMDTIGPDMKPLDMRAMKLAPKWAGQPQTFGSPYTCALKDTVTEVCSRQSTLHRSASRAADPACCPTQRWCRHLCCNTACSGTAVPAVCGG